MVYLFEIWVEIDTSITVKHHHLVLNLGCFLYDVTTIIHLKFNIHKKRDTGEFIQICNVLNQYTMISGPRAGTPSILELHRYTPKQRLWLSLGVFNRLQTRRRCKKQHLPTSITRHQSIGCKITYAMAWYAISYDSPLPMSKVTSQ